MMHLMYNKLKELGYEICEVEHKVSDSPKVEVNIGMHGVGEQGHGVGPKIWSDTDDPFRSKLVLKPSQLHAFEIFVYTPLPEWGGKKLTIGTEENIIVTENGVELFAPTQDKITLIR
jgi:hypothetical protein